MANDILVKVGADITDFSRKMSESNKALQNFGKANAETFDAFKRTGAAAVGVGTAIGAGLGIAVKTAAGFEQAMSNVAAISGATGDEFDALRKKAIEMGESTVFSASESADAMANLAQMGWETDQMLDGIEHTLNLAAAGGLELADAAMIMANTMNQFNIEADEAQRVSDVMAKVAASAGTDVYQMGDAMQYAGANAAAAGLSIEDTAAFIGILGDAGITGSKAGTALNAMLRDLKKNSEDGAIAVGEQSIALYDAEGNMRNMPDVISEIITATDKMSGAQRDAALSAILGDQALVGFNAIASKGADSVGNLAAELYGSEGAAADMADVMQDNLLGALTELGSAFEGVQIALGSALVPLVRKFTEYLTKLLGWFNSLSDETKSSIAIFLALGAALAIAGGGLMLIIGFIPQMISGFTTIMTVVKSLGAVFGAALSPAGLIIGAIIALGVGLVYAYKRFEGFRNVVNRVWDNIVKATQKAVGFIRYIVVTIYESIANFVGEQLDKIRKFWDENGEMILQAVQNVWGFISKVIETVMNVVWSIIKWVWPAVEALIIGTWNNIKTVISTAIDIILGLVKVFSALFTGDWEALWEGVKEIGSSIWEGIKEIFWNSLMWIIEAFENLFGGFIEIVVELFEQFKEFFVGLWTDTKESTVGIWTDMFDAVLEFISPFIDSVIEWFELLRDGISDIWDGIKDIAEGAWELIKNVILGPVLLIVNLVTGNFEELKENAEAILENLKDAIEKIWEGIKKVFSAAVDLVVDIAKKAWDNLKKNTVEIFNNVKDSISKAWDNAKEATSRIVGNLKDAAVRKFNDVVSSTREKMTEAKDKVAEIWGKAVDAIKNIDLYQVGKDAIQGLINGVGAMAGAVWDKAKSIGSSIMGGIKGVLGIASPSKVLRQYGLWTGEGLAQGIERSRRIVERASDLLGEAAIPDKQTIDMSYATPDGVTARSLASAVSGTVDVNSRDDRLINAIGALERRLTDLEVVMDGEKVGRIVRPHVNEGNALDETVGRYFD